MKNNRILLSLKPEHDLYLRCIFSENANGVSISLPWCTKSRIENAYETQIINADDRFRLVTKYVAELHSPKTTNRGMVICALLAT